MKWVEAEGPHFGNGGPTWVEDNLEAFVNIAGPLLGLWLPSGLLACCLLL